MKTLMLLLTFMAIGCGDDDRPDFVCDEGYCEVKFDSLTHVGISGCNDLPMVITYEVTSGEYEQVMTNPSLFDETVLSLGIGGVDGDGCPGELPRVIYK